MGFGRFALKVNRILYCLLANARNIVVWKQNKIPPEGGSEYRIQLCEEGRQKFIYGGFQNYCFIWKHVQMLQVASKLIKLH